MVYLKTKNCPFCSKEISDEAIICKYCHRLLIDENGNDILPDGEMTEEPEEEAVTEEKTIVYKKADLQKLMEESASAQENGGEEETDEAEDGEGFGGFDNEDEENGGDEAFEESGAVINDEYSDDEGFAPDGDDDGGEGYEDEGYGYEEEPAPVPQRAPRRAAPRGRDDRYDDADLADAADYDPKRTFMVTAIVTLGILVILIVAILAGYKLFGFGKGGEEKTDPAPLAAGNSTAAAADSTAASDPAATGTGSTAAAPADDSFVPSVVNDTLSENPEEIVNSAASDPVVDSAAQQPETPADSTASSDDSGVNIVIRPDPGSDSSSVADSTTDSVGDGPSSSDAGSSSASEPAGPGAPGFEAAGSYYSWGEANTLMDNYAQSNGFSGYEYSYGTDGVEMVYVVYDENGNATYYRVDLQTGYVTAL